MSESEKCGKDICKKMTTVNPNIKEKRGEI
jgi:hypothetical protein